MTTALLPKASILLISYNQEAKIQEAINGALAQTYSPLEIIISDDCSSDKTWENIEKSVSGYQGPHHIILNKNPSNMGIGAHLSKLVNMASGELLFVAAGDDVSLPNRCEAVVNAWLQAERKPDLISTDLVDMDADGKLHDVIHPADLTGMTLNDWLTQHPYVIGAAHTWHRRLFERFGPLPEGVTGEDLIMTFRAIINNGAISVRTPLVNYRRGGISRRVRAMNAQTVINRIKKNNKCALVEIPQLINDAHTAGIGNKLELHFSEKLEKERFIRNMFSATGFAQKTALLSRKKVNLTTKIRIYLYATSPIIFKPFFAAKRFLASKD